jgi:hypothetical protein
MNIQQRLLRLESITPPTEGGLFAADSITIEVINSDMNVIQTKIVNFNEPIKHPTTN